MQKTDGPLELDDRVNMTVAKFCFISYPVVSLCTVGPYVTCEEVVGICAMQLYSTRRVGYQRNNIIALWFLSVMEQRNWICSNEREPQ